VDIDQEGVFIQGKKQEATKFNMILPLLLENLLLDFNLSLKGDLHL
jgi:hypothetical protein